MSSCEKGCKFKFNVQDHDVQKAKRAFTFTFINWDCRNDVTIIKCNKITPLNRGVQKWILRFSETNEQKLFQNQRKRKFSG